jgi:hypothetical protein
MSHNPPNSELLDFTDQYGMLVWDENRNFDNTPQYRDDVARLVQRDRNHPSIFLWSLCNEGGCMEGANDANALSVAQNLTAIIRANDPINTRYVSAAWNADQNDLLNGWGPKVLDVQGINYNYGEYDPYHSTYPTKPIIASETASCTGARGVYVTNDTAAHKDIYSADSCAQGWWTADFQRAFIEGGFAWTGFDYKGEPTPYSWPEVNSNFGIIDLAGFPKDTFWYYQSWWQSSPVLHLFPHWNTPKIIPGTHAVTCDSSQATQKWNWTGGSGQGQIKLISTGQCVSAACNNVSTGCQPLALVNCDSSQALLFTHGSDNAFKSVQNGGCMDLWNSGVGPSVGVYSCDGAAGQKWDYDSATGLIRSEATNPSGRCLTSASTVSVWAYTNAASVELFLNSASQGKKTVPSLGHVQWDLNYVAGNIQAVSYDGSGNQVLKETIETTGAPATIVLQNEYPSNGQITADGQDVALIKVSVVDSQGRAVPDASNVINFSVSGAGSLYGVGNGDPSCHEPDKGNSRSLFNGLARAIVKSTNTAGTITLSASSNGLKSASLTVTTSSA